MFLFDIPSCDRSSHGKLFETSLLPGELKSSHHCDINPLYHPMRCIAHIYIYILPSPSGCMQGVYMCYTPCRGGITYILYHI